MQTKNPKFVVKFITDSELSTFNPSKKFVTPNEHTTDKTTVAMFIINDVIPKDEIELFSPWILYPISFTIAILLFSIGLLNISFVSFIVFILVATLSVVEFVTFISF